MDPILNETWLHGTYQIDGQDCEIDTRLSYLSVGESFFSQGEDADKAIKEIHQIWLTDDCTQDEAFKKWINLNL